jgi:uncharacterized protein (DUF2235 family)
VNIAVFLDGTWNEPHTNTNVIQLSERTQPADSGGTRQVVVYRAGVGSKRGERLRGGLFGYGLNEQIEEAYAAIAAAYTAPGDRLYLIGYSRGAFSARSLAGMIARCGIIRDEDLPVERVFKRYRRGKASPGLNEMQRGESAPQDEEDRLVLERSTLARIRFIGVFDTVGSLGIPGGLFRPLVRRRYEFHDTKLSGLVDHARHAVAIDEQRPHFEATLWDGVPKPIPGHTTTVVQRWFAGSHGNVGGGGTNLPETDNPLSTIAREWLCDEAREAGLEIVPDPYPGQAWRGPLNDSYAAFGKGLFYKVVRWRKRLYRTIDTTVNGQELAPAAARRYRELPDYRPRMNPGFDDALARAPISSDSAVDP